MRRKHADLIHAWAEGAEIQIKQGDEWVDYEHPTWGVTCEYRIKPEQKPDVVKGMFVEANPKLDNAYNAHNLRLTFDGETGKLKKAEVI